MGRFFRELLSELANPGAGIEDQVMTALEFDMNTGSVATVLHCLWPRYRGRASHAVESDDHFLRLLGWCLRTCGIANIINLCLIVRVYQHQPE